MTENGTEQAFLDRTMKELMGDGFEGYSVVFIGYANLNSGNRITYGRCIYRSRTRCDIQLGDMPWDKHPLFREATLWHEACHAKLYLEDGENNSHDREFRKLRRTKKLYWLADLVMKIVWCTKR